MPLYNGYYYGYSPEDAYRQYFEAEQKKRSDAALAVEVETEKTKGLDEQRKKRGRASTQLTGSQGADTRLAPVVSAGRTLLGGY